MGKFKVAVFDDSGQRLHVYPVIVEGEDAAEAVEAARQAAVNDRLVNPADAHTLILRILPEEARS